MFPWIIKRLDGYSPAYDRDQVIAVVATIIFAFLDALTHFVFVFVNWNNPVLYIMNIVCFVLVFASLYLILIKYRYVLACYILIFVQCYYIIYITYFLGYNIDGVILIPVVIFAIYSILKLKEKHITILTGMVVVSFIIILMINFFTVPVYEGEVGYLKYLNAIFAIVFCGFIIYSKSIAEIFMDKYGKDDKGAISREAYQDFLTGLWNRRFMEKVFDSMENIDKGVIVLADIDFFKKVNDNYGHNTGDYVLRRISDIYRNNLRECDVICRWGGEEFLFYIKDATEETATEIMENLRMKIERTNFRFEEHRFNITVSFGLTAVDSKVDILENIDRADKAMYYCKNNGRNMVAGYSVCKEHICGEEDNK